VYIQNVTGSKVSHKGGSAASGKQAKQTLKRPDPPFLQTGVNPPVQGTLPSPSKPVRRQVKRNPAPVFRTANGSFGLGVSYCELLSKRKGVKCLGQQGKGGARPG